MLSRFFFATIAALACAPVAWAQPSANFTRTEDVIYGRKFGTALTMDVFTPKENANGKGIIWCVSGGWFSSKPDTHQMMPLPLAFSLGVNTNGKGIIWCVSGGWFSSKPPGVGL